MWLVKLRLDLRKLLRCLCIVKFCAYFGFSRFWLPMAFNLEGCSYVALSCSMDLLCFVASVVR